MSLPAFRRILDLARSPAAGTLAVTTAIGLLCKGTAFGRELLIAARFGATPALDVYLVAIMIPTLVVNVAGNVLAISLLPQLLKVRREHGPAAEAIAQRRGVFWCLLALTALALLLSATGPLTLPWLAPGFSAAELGRAAQLQWAATPFGVLASASRLYAVLAEAEGRLRRSSFSPLLTALASIGLLVSFGGDSPGLLIVGLTIGAAAELIYNAAGLRGTRYDAVPIPGAWTDFERALLSVVWPISLGTLIQGTTVMIDQSFASLAGGGAISELAYGGRIVAVTIGLVGTPLLQMAFPRFAALAAGNQPDELWRQFLRFCGVTLAASLPLVVVLSGLSSWIVSMTFERGAFSAEVATRVSLIQAFGALQIPLTIIWMLGQRVLFSYGMRRAMLMQGIAAVMVNLALDAILFRWLGVPGIALATSALAFVMAAFVTGIIFRSVRRLPGAAGTPQELRRAA